MPTRAEGGLGPLALLRAVLDCTNDAIQVIDPQSGQLLDVNRKSCLNLGYSRDELVALTIFDVDPGMNRAAFKQRVDKLRASGSLTMMIEGVRRRKDGATFPVEA